ncbi:hypothetical protein CP975_00995 [Streptomyces alboniger]|uniref:Tetratricopeptide repeat protein n=1 Tax=Streptomyces alboniger TaxID=132473 RepID=A0A5J6HS62_STRAD|nr:hypothetical protein CP975_00995 [Streptomyces alboniger]
MLGGVEATWQESAEVCADAAWQARSIGRSALLFLDPQEIARHDDLTRARALRHLYLNGLRYDFRCHSIESLLGTLASPGRHELDCYTRALRAFALLAQSNSRGYTLMEEVLAQAGDHVKTLHVLLHGLWLAHGLAGRERAMFHILGRKAFADRVDPIALFREATAHRGLGRYAQALAAIDEAVEHLPPAAVNVHADFVRERCLIIAIHEMRDRYLT